MENIGAFEQTEDFFVDLVNEMLNIQEQLLQEEDDGGAPGAGAGEQEAAAGGQGRGQPRVEECVKSYHHQNDAKLNVGL